MQHDTHIISPGEDVNSSNSIGARPRLPAGTEWPVCRECDQNMTFYLQFTIEERFGLPLSAGSHFVLFQCRDHGDAAEIDEFFDMGTRQRLPANYWDLLAPFNYIRLFPATRQLSASDDEPLLRPRGLDILLQAESTSGIQDFKIGGNPSWAQNPTDLKYCSCGGPLTFLCQIPEDYEFPTREGAPEQKDTYSATEYKLFIGNEVYFLACQAACDPRAVWPIVQ